VVSHTLVVDKTLLGFDLKHLNTFVQLWLGQDRYVIPKLS
jgi:hypothetical protein